MKNLFHKIYMYFKGKEIWDAKMSEDLEITVVAAPQSDSASNSHLEKSLCGENDNYFYPSQGEMSLEEQLDSAKKALESAIRLSENIPCDYFDRKIEEINKRILELNQLIENS